LRRVAALAAVVCGAVFAAGVDDEPLEPERAFPLEARLVSDGTGAPRVIELRFTIRDGYYLYGDRFRVESPGLPVGRLAVPDGAVKDDPFVGKTRILRGAASLRLPLQSRPAPGDYVLVVTAQGCAENRICYAPFTQSAHLTFP
jgi:thiol:disulfide interchange protein DsbD